MTSFLIGCDPEFMIVNKEKALRSALSIFEGRKHTPAALMDGASLADNVNFEFNTKPASNAIEFKKYIKSVLAESSRKLPEGHKFAAISGADFPASELKDPEALEFGCEPDFNAWKNGAVNIVPEGAAERTFRSAGGHIHVGFTDESQAFLSGYDDKIRFIKLMDAIIGVPSVFLDKTQGTDVRRSLYGKAGCFRMKPYGVEYRTVSNFWAANPKAVDVIYGLTAVAVDIRKNEQDEILIGQMDEQRIVKSINESDKDLARQLYLEFIAPMIPESLSKMVLSVAKTNSLDVHKNWKLSQGA